MKGKYNAEIEALSLEADEIRRQTRERESAAHEARNVASALSEALTEKDLTAEIVDRLARMNEDIRAGRVQTVLVRNVARLCRDACLIHAWLQQAEKHGVAVISVQDGNVVDLMHPLRLMLRSQRLIPADSENG